jgi:pilus assembly protein CpaE
VSARVIVNGHTDPLHDVDPRPDLLLLHHVQGYGELEYLATVSPNQRPRLLVFGPAGDPAAMRLAMRAGASDYLPEPLNSADLLHSLERVCAELSQKTGGSGNLVTVLNSKGGAGASFVATNLACGLAQDESRRTALMDLDLQFGALARYLDLTPARGLAEALDAIDDMDQAAAEAFVTPHRSGVRLLAAPSEHLVPQTRVGAEQIDGLLQVFLQHNNYVVADLPRRIDAFCTTVLERSDRILLVVQQSLAHINCAAKVLQLVSGELAIHRDRVEVVVNRFVKNSLIELGDVRKTLRVENLHVIPNQYKLVSDSIDTGKPVSESAKGSAVAKALRELTARISDSGRDGTRRSGLLGRALPKLLGAN